MKRRHPIRFFAEVLGVWLAYGLIPWLPRLVVVSLARGLGFVACSCAPALRRIALANIQVAFGSHFTEKERRRVTRESFRTFALALLDLFWFGRFTEARIRRYVHLDPETLDLMRREGGRIALTAHLGNWEILGQALTLNCRPMASVAAELDNPVVDRLLTKMRTRTGQEIIPQQGALKALVSRLHKGGQVAFVLDQNTVPRDGGAFVRLFGLPVPLATSAAELALRRNVPILFIVCRHIGGGHYRSASWPVPAIPGEDTAIAVTERIASTLEEAVRGAPGQWLWMYKRWKFRMDDSRTSAYPFYSRLLSAAEWGRARTQSGSAMETVS